MYKYLPVYSVANRRQDSTAEARSYIRTVLAIHIQVQVQYSIPVRVFVYLTAFTLVPIIIIGKLGTGNWYVPIIGGLGYSTALIIISLFIAA